MEAEHKDILRKHQVKLVENMMMDSNLLDFLKEKRVLTASMDEDVKAQKPLRNQARELLQVLPKRGPNAFGHFLCCLQLSGHEHLARSLYDTCRTPPTLLIDQYEDQYKRSLLELCGTRVSGVQSGTTLPASSATLPASSATLPASSATLPASSATSSAFSATLQTQSQPANRFGFLVQVSGDLDDYNNINGSTMILNMVTAVQANILANVFTMLGHQVRYIDENNPVRVNACNEIKEFMEKAQTSVVCIVVLALGDALNDETPVSGGANLSSVGALKAAFYQAARSNMLANKPKFLLQIGFVSDGTDAIRGQVDNVDANIPPASGTQGTSNPNIIPSLADCCVLQVNLRTLTVCFALHDLLQW